MDNIKYNFQKAKAITSFVRDCVQEFPPTYSLESHGIRQVVPDSVSRREMEAKIAQCEVAKKRLDQFPDVRIHRDSSSSATASATSSYSVKSEIPKW